MKTSNFNENGNIGKTAGKYVHTASCMEPKIGGVLPSLISIPWLLVKLLLKGKIFF